MKPLSSSQRVMPSMSSTLPGATDSDCVATISRAGTRWSAALTVVSRIDGRSRPLTRASRASAVMRCATTPACGDTRSYGRQSQAGNSSTAMSGAKNVSARASAAMRGPSRQITTRLVAGGLGRAATARARSATTSPSAPSATPERVSGRPGSSSSAGDFAIVRRSPGWSGSRADAGTAGRHGTTGTSASPVSHASSSPSGMFIRLSNSLSSASVNCSMLLSAKRPRIRSTSRKPAMPSPKQQLAAPEIQSLARTLRSAHPFLNAKSPDGPGGRSIAGCSPIVRRDVCAGLSNENACHALAWHQPA